MEQVPSMPMRLPSTGSIEAPLSVLSCIRMRDDRTQPPKAKANSSPGEDHPESNLPHQGHRSRLELDGHATAELETHAGAHRWKVQRANPSLVKLPERF